MEILDNQYTQEAGDEGLQVTRNMKVHWLSTSKWAMFLAILGFIYTGLALLMTAFMMPMLKMAMTMGGQAELAELMESAGIVFVIVMVLAVGVMFFIHLYHLRFATNIQRAMQYESQDAFEAAWRNFRNYFRLNGIVTIAFIALYLIALIVIGGMAATRSEF
ncbi:MAG: hypothetical protein DYG98_01945 [Haliscomenobacteraceae bacterium CHB4]|nr:hypothetical protein [Saprospiraceae bacterium]MCE7921793.1 hypothetical protein [Haliscomenobacteraceae bacterium CHB4]